MTLNPLVFSNNPRYRISRHVMFWTIWVLYFSIFMALSWQPKFTFAHSFADSLMEEIGSIPLDMTFCYSIIYFLIPRYLHRGQYVTMVVLWIFFSMLFVAGQRFYSANIVPAIRGFNNMPVRAHSMGYIWDFFYLFSQINMEGCIAASIKIGKMWFIKQQELELIKKEKQKIEPNLQEGKMQPVFLLHALDRVEQLSATQPSLIPQMVKRIKSLFLYVIYDNNQASVGLEKELKLLEEYVELEKTGVTNGLQVSVRITGSSAGERIAPFIILPLVENGFRQLAQLDMTGKTLDLEIRVGEGNMHMKLGWSKPIDSSTLANGGNVSLQGIGKRLGLLYPQSHELKVVITSEQFIVDLWIDLHRAIN
jgi:hypothetical protein